MFQILITSPMYFSPAATFPPMYIISAKLKLQKFLEDAIAFHTFLHLNTFNLFFLPALPHFFGLLESYLTFIQQIFTEHLLCAKYLGIDCVRAFEHA